jgi:VWFA-related protein
MTSRRLMALAVVTVLGFGLAQAQGPRRDVGESVPLPPLPASEAGLDVDVDDRFALSIDVEVVNVDVVVTDRNDNPISGLQKDHFRVFVDDEEQLVTNFSPTDTPLTVVILLEFGENFTYYYDDVIGPAAGFINSLRENDWAAIVTYDLRTQIVTDFTQNRNELFNGLRSLVLPGFRETAFFDAVIFTLERMENIEGKKAIFLLSSGIDTFSKQNYNAMLRAAETSDTMIYPIGMGEMFFLFNEDRIGTLGRMQMLQARNALQSLARASGGTYFLPRFPGEYPSIYETVSVHLRNQYSLGFVPRDLQQDDDLRELRVEVADLDVNGDGELDRLRTRHKKGFYNTVEE